MSNHSGTEWFTVIHAKSLLLCSKAHTHLVLTVQVNLSLPVALLIRLTRGFGPKFYGLDALPDDNQQNHIFSASSLTVDEKGRHFSIGCPLEFPRHALNPCV